MSSVWRRESSARLVGTSNLVPRDQGAATIADDFFEAPQVGLGDLSGTAALTFISAGLLLGNSVFSAISSLTFTQVGNLARSSALSSASSLIFTSNGVLTATSVLTAFSNLTFTPTANLTVVGGGAAALSGSSSLTFTTSTNVTGGSSLSATAALTFVPTGDLAGASSLLASSNLIFISSGELISNLALSGTITLAFYYVGGNDDPIVPSFTPPPSYPPNLSPMATSTERSFPYSQDRGGKPGASAYGHNSSQRLGKMFISGNPKAHRLGSPRPGRKR